MTKKNLRFGIEIELVGLTIARAAVAVAGALNSSVSHTGGYYRKQTVRQADGRSWTVMSDASVSNGCEVVSPILTYSDIETVQNIVRALRSAGGRTHHSCGIHIHIDGERFKMDPQSIRRLALNMNKDEDLYFAALATCPSRRAQWCKPVSQRFLDAIKSYKGKRLGEIERRWYTSQGFNATARSQHYNGSRYHALNLHSLFFRGTVEFRWFETSLHAGVVKSFIQLTLAIAAKALDSKRATTAKRAYDPTNAKYDIHHLLHSLGLTGPEFKTCRHHLTKHLPGRNAGRRQAA